MLLPIGTPVRTTEESGVEEVLHGTVKRHTGSESMPYIVEINGTDVWMFENDIEEDKQ